MVKAQPPTFASCCVGVTGLERHVFFVPREDIGRQVPEAMLAEIKEIMHKVVPPGKGNFGMRVARKNYAFEMPNVPREEASYVELVYTHKFPALPTDLTGKTFSKVFGARSSALETVLLYQDIMGPCWLEIKNVKPVSVPLSYCTHEVGTGCVLCFAPLLLCVRNAPPVRVVLRR